MSAAPQETSNVLVDGSRALIAKLTTVAAITPEDRCVLAHDYRRLEKASGFNPNYLHIDQRV
jgi:hypothetical protein